MNMNTTASNEANNSMKTLYSEASIKDLMAAPEVQAALRKYVSLCDNVVVKKLRKAYKNPNTKDTTQKVEGLSGKSMEESDIVSFTLVNTELNPEEAINKTYRIVDYTYALEANMKDGNFGGYAATGLKLLVTKLEEVKNVEVSK